MHTVTVPKVPADPAKIKALIHARDITQAVVAMRARINETTFSKQLRGQRPIDLLELSRVADVLNVDWKQLLLDECTVCHQPYSRVAV